MYLKNSHATRDLPMPAIPTTETKCAFRSSAEPGDAGDEIEGGPHRAFGVILSRQRRPPNGHDGIADELLYRSAVARDEAAAQVEVPCQQVTYLFGIARFRQRGEPDEVGEKNR